MNQVCLIWGNQEFDLSERFEKLKTEAMGPNPPGEAIYSFEVGEIIQDQTGQKLSELIQAVETVSFFSPEVMVHLKGVQALKAKKQATDGLERELAAINLVKGEMEGQEVWWDQDSLSVNQASHRHMTAIRIVEEMHGLGQGRFYLKLHPAWVGRQVWRKKEKDFEGLVIEDFLISRLKAKIQFQRPAELNPSPPNGGGKLLEVLLEWIEDPPQGVYLVLQAEVKKLAELSNKLQRAIKQKGKEYKGEVSYDDYRPTGWVVQRAKLMGFSIDPMAAALLIEMAGSELSVLAQELEKLSLHIKAGQSIGEGEILQWASPSSRFSIFLVSEHLSKRNLSHSLKSIEQIIREKIIEPTGLFALVSGQFRRLLKISWMLQDGKSPKDISQALKLHPWIAEKITATARGFSTKELEKLLVYMAEQDLKIKGSPRDALAIFENLAFLVCRGAFR